MPFKVYLLLVFIILTSGAIYAQDLESWQVYPSFNTVNSVSLSGHGEVYSATTGGLFVVQNDEITRTFTTMDGLNRSDVSICILDNSTGQLFLGYSDGMIDVLDIETDEIISLSDISRIDRFSSKRINDAKIYNNDLYLASDFGIVVIGTQNLLVKESYLKFNEFELGIQVNAIEIINDTVYAATNSGVAVGNLNEDLSLATNWLTYSEQDGLVTNIISDIAVHRNSIYVVIEGKLYKRDSQDWILTNDTGGSNADGLSINNDDELIIKQSSKFRIVNSTGDITFVELDTSDRITDLYKSDSKVYIGTLDGGTVEYDLNTDTILRYVPMGPFSHFFKGLSFDAENGTLISAATNETARNSIIDAGKGYSIFNGDSWININSRNRETLWDDRFQQTFTSTVTDDFYYFGSWGQGVVRHDKESGESYVFNEKNSTIRGWDDDDPNYPVVSGLDTDSKGNVWLVSRYAQNPLYFQTPGDDDWVMLPKSSSVSSTDEYVGLFVDSNDQKWISLQNSSSVSGTGLLVIKTEDPNDPSDDESVKLSTDENSGMLPDAQVNAMIEDKTGEVWIGTGRGIARFLFPEFITSTPNPTERRSQWLINEDTSAISRYLLRDVNVSAMAVNGANQKWIGSVNQGLWLLNAEGSKILKRFSTDNSPLISNNITSITVNEETGEVFVATDLGLMSYMEVAKAPENEMATLKVYPNPFVYDKHEKIMIDELSESTLIRIIGVDGSVLQELQGTGGRIEWDGRDFGGKKLGSGVYIVVALDDNSGSKGVGKVVIIN